MSNSLAISFSVSCTRGATNSMSGLSSVCAFSNKLIYYSLNIGGITPSIALIPLSWNNLMFGMGSFTKNHYLVRFFKLEIDWTPTARVVRVPFLNTIIVGMLIIPNWVAKSEFSSVFTLQTFTVGTSAEKLSSIGDWLRQGPHQGAQKSITTVPLKFVTSASKLREFSSVCMIISPFVRLSHGLYFMIYLYFTIYWLIKLCKLNILLNIYNVSSCIMAA